MFDPYKSYMARVKHAGFIDAVRTGASNLAGKVAPLAQQAGEAIKTHGPAVMGAMGATGTRLDAAAQRYHTYKAIGQDLVHNLPRMAGKTPAPAAPTPSAAQHLATGAALGAAGMYVGNELAKQ